MRSALVFAAGRLRGMVRNEDAGLGLGLVKSMTRCEGNARRSAAVGTSDPSSWLSVTGGRLGRGDVVAGTRELVGREDEGVAIR